MFIKEPINKIYKEDLLRINNKKTKEDNKKKEKKLDPIKEYKHSGLIFLD